MVGPDILFLGSWVGDSLLIQAIPEDQACICTPKRWHGCSVCDGALLHNQGAKQVCIAQQVLLLEDAKPAADGEAEGGPEAVHASKRPRLERALPGLGEDEDHEVIRDGILQQVVCCIGVLWWASLGECLVRSRCIAGLRCNSFRVVTPYDIMYLQQFSHFGNRALLYA